MEEVDFSDLDPLCDRIGPASLEIHKDQEQELEDPGIWVQFQASQLTEALANRLAAVLAQFIRLITPAINDLGNESDQTNIGYSTVAPEVRSTQGFPFAP